MREILFRGKCIDNGEWVEGAFSAWSCYLPFSPEVYKPSIIKYGEPYSGYWFDVYPESVGQYTGMIDKNGKKIFEGDIVRHYNIDELPNEFEIGKIIFVEDECCFKRTCNNGFSKCYISSDCIYEVIGNIYDNPELMEVSE